MNYKTAPEYIPNRDYIDLEKEILEAFILAKDSSTIQLPEGHFLFSQSLSLDDKKHLSIKGKGMDKTVLSFKGQQQGAEGIKITNSQNIILEDFSIEDAAGDNLKISDTDTIILRRIRTAWTGEVSTKNGAYGIYPVLSTHVLIEECEAIGASDAGMIAEKRARPAQSCDVHPERPIVNVISSISKLQNEGIPESISLTFTLGVNGNKSFITLSLLLPQTFIFLFSEP